MHDTRRSKMYQFSAVRMMMAVPLCSVSTPGNSPIRLTVLLNENESQVRENLLLLSEGHCY